MNEEVKLILTKLKIVSEEKENGAYICDKEHGKLLLSYIEQLEEDKEILIRNNNIGNERLKELQNINKQLENNRDKAIEFIEKYRTHEKIGNNDYLKGRDDFGDLDRWQVFELIDILKGGSDD